MTVLAKEKRSSHASAWIQIAVLAVLLILFCILVRLAFFRTYTAYVPLHIEGDRQVRLVVEDPEVLRVGEASRKGNYLLIPVEPLRSGKTEIEVLDESGTGLFLLPLHISPLKTVYNHNDGSFTGDSAVLIALSVFWLTVSAIMLWHFFHSRGPAFYSYTSIYFSGFGLFALVTGGMMTYVTVQHLLHPERYSMIVTYSTINGASRQFMEVTAPLIVVYEGIEKQGKRGVCIPTSCI